MLDKIARGLRASFDQGALPGPARQGAWMTLGNIPLVPSQGVARTATYRAIYRTNPWVYAAVNKLARDFSRLPLHVYALDENANKQRVRGDIGLTPGRMSGGQALDVLLSGRRYGGRSSNAMKKATARDWLVYGNALWELKRGPAGIIGLQIIPWRWVNWIETAEDLSPLFYQITPARLYSYGAPTGRTRSILPTDVIHFGLGADPEQTWDLSPLESCGNTLALHDALARHLLAYFANSARPSGFLSVDNLDAKKAEVIRTLIRDLYASPENAGKILAGMGTWQKLGDAPDQSSIVELIKRSREEIAAAYHLPPPVIGILEQAIKSNVKELREQYNRDALGPFVSDFEAELMAQLLPQQPSWAGLFVEADMGELLRPDLEARAGVYTKMKSVYTVDEIRTMENKPPLNIPGITDVPWAASGDKPLTAFRGNATSTNTLGV